jgi:hypothetical protein
MLLHQLVNKPIPPPHPLQQQALGAVVEKAGATVAIAVSLEGRMGQILKRVLVL